MKTTSLLEQAKAIRWSSKRGRRRYTREQVEIVVAFLNGKISGPAMLQVLEVGQNARYHLVVHALEEGIASNWVTVKMKEHA